MILCPKCEGHSGVLETRVFERASSRRRFCKACRHIFATVEVVVVDTNDMKSVVRRKTK